MQTLPALHMPLPKSVRACLLLALASVLGGCNTVLLNPSGDVAVQQGHLIIISTVLMLLIIVPVIILTLVFAWRYRASNTEAPYHPDWDHSMVLELVIWSAPLLIIIALGALTWISTHTLDPYRPLQQIDAEHRIPAGTQPLTVEVVALDWKWLFIYPDQGIAVVNELAAPVDVPIRFHITAESVMNAFYIPALAGQIYAMPGMQTQLNAVINHPGNFEGISANYSGAGFSGMHFRFHGMSVSDFDRWVQQARAAGGTLDRGAYRELAQPTSWVPVRRYGAIAPDLYDAILNRCVEPGTMCIRDMMAMPNVAQAGHEGHEAHAGHDGHEAAPAAAAPAKE
jgi:cytochrome o ubiquinol oxidase subunit 2